MKKVDPSQAISVIANIGVIAGIAFLAFELRQNNDLLGIELRSSQLDRQVSMVDVVLNNSDVDLLGLLAQPDISMSSSDRDTLALLGIRMLIVFEQAFEEARAGLRNEEDTIQTLRSIYQRPVLNYGVPIAWETYRGRAGPAFVVWMEEHIIVDE